MESEISDRPLSAEAALKRNDLFLQRKKPNFRCRKRKGKHGRDGEMSKGQKMHFRLLDSRDVEKKGKSQYSMYSFVSRD